MLKSELPRDLVSLIHHLELSDASWRDKVIEQLIVAVIYLSHEKIGIVEIRKRLRSQFSVAIEPHRLRDLVERFCSQHILLKLSDGKYKVSEEILSRFIKDLEEARKTEENVECRFVQILEEHCPNLNAQKCWEDFNENFLFPLIRETGARTYELVSGNRSSLHTEDTFLKFLGAYEEEMRELMQKALSLFFDPTDTQVRSYVLRYLNAYFFLESCNLSEKTLKAIYDSVSEPHPLKIFVDTNFLFAFFEMHKPSTNEAAKMLTETLLELPKNLSAEIYVTSITLREGKGVLEREIKRFKSRHMTCRMAEMGVNADADGFYQHIARETLSAKRTINAPEHLKQYLHNIRRISKEKGLRVFELNVNDYKNDDRVRKDFNRQISFEKDQFGSIAKTKWQLNHDIVLWHFVKDQRPSSAETPMEAGCWIVTLDHRFVVYDAWKVHQRECEVPVCLYPTNLIQMMQFWIPRTIDLEDKLFRSFRASLFHRFGYDAEKVTTRILDSLSYYEAFDSLSQETVKAILLNKALRRKIAVTDSKDGADQLIEAVILSKKEEVVNEKDKLDLEKKKLSQLNIALCVVLSITLVALFELLVHKAPWTWLIEHRNALTIQIAVDVSIVAFFIGLAFKCLRKVCWGTIIVGLLIAVISSLDGH